MNKIIFLFLLVSAIECAEFEFSALNSTFSNDTLELDGSVFLNTPFGTIEADYAEATGDVNKLLKKGNFVFSQNVVIELKGGQKIFCDKASLNTAAMEGECLGIKTSIKMISADKKLSVSCKLVSFSYKESEKHSAFIEEMRGVGDVVITMNTGVTASGDVIHLVNSQEDKILSQYQLMANAPNQCLFTTPFGLKIESPKILFSEKEFIRFYDPKGECLSQGEKMEFSSTFLTWLATKNAMVLEGKSLITMQPLSWQTDGIVTLFFDDKKALALETPSKNLWKAIPVAIDAKGDMIFSNSKRGMTLNTVGKAHYSAKDYHLIIEKDELASQIQIVDQFGQIFSNSVIFMLNPKGVTPFDIETVDLLGNISLINKMFSSKEQEALQYILADSAKIVLKTESALFNANKGKRVLIMDKINRMQVSAPSITVKKDKGVIPFSIKGNGDVRFSFKEEELAEIKKRFMKQGNR